MDIKEIESAMEGILFAAGEPITLDRLAQTLEIDTDTIKTLAGRLADYYSFERRGIRLLRLENTLQLCSAPEHADLIRKALESRKPPKLSQPALEALCVIAYFQPTTKAYVEQVRGVDSSYTIGLLSERGLIEECGRLSVPGRPILYRTTSEFLKTFGLSSLEELPELPDSGLEEKQLSLLAAMPQAEETP